MNEAIKKLGEITLLYIEDDKISREEIEFLLQTFVKELIVAKDGEEGLKAYHTHRPDLILTDIQMPVMNGLDMIKVIRETDKKIPIVITTAFNDNDYLFKAIDLDVTAYLTKPIDSKKLLNKLAELAHNILLEKENEKMHRFLLQYQQGVEESSCVLMVDRAFRIVSMNRRLSKKLQIDPNIYKGKPVGDLLRLREKNEEKGLESIAESQDWHGTLTAVSPAGQKIYFRSAIIPINHYALPDVNRMLIMQDITELVTFQELLQNELESTRSSLQEKLNFLRQYQDIINESTAVCAFDIEGTIRYSDKSFYRTLGFESDEEIFGRSIFEFCRKSRDAIKEAIEHTIETGKIVKIQTRCQTADGTEERIANSFFKPLYRLDGTIDEIISIHQDITETVQLNEEIKSTQKEILFRLGEVAENHSKETGQHVHRVTEYSLLLAKLAGLKREDQEVLYAAAPMHDIGKLTIPTHILHKEGPLTPEEFEIMKTHTTNGAKMFEGSERPFMKAASIVAAEHHENYDGTGYPKGLKAEEIHIFGRIVAIADVFDALSMPRAYKKAWPIEKILDFMQEQRGKKFDPRLIDLFFQEVESFIEIRRKY